MLQGTLLEQSSSIGRAALFDLALAPGDYIVSLPRGNGETHPLRLSSTSSQEDFDPEPNDTAASGLRIADGDSSSGRLARVGRDSTTTPWASNQVTYGVAISS